MIDFKVPYTKILAINPHPNADRLQLATVYGFQVVCQKDRYKVGDKVIFIPVDSVITEQMEALLFDKDSKIKLEKRRIRQIKIRSFPSQGMLVEPSEIASIVNPKFLSEEQDLAAILGVTKYEPPQRGPEYTAPGVKKNRNKVHDHPDFHKYNGVGNIKWFPNMFIEGETQVVIQEKLHGTNARASVQIFQANRWYKKLLKFFGTRLGWGDYTTENCYGSNNVEISANLAYKGYYGEDVYGSVFKKLDVFSKIKCGESIFGEIIGPKIQTDAYSYGLKEHKFILFDVKVKEVDGQRWLSPNEVQVFAKERGFEMVPVLYEGVFNKEMAHSLTKGPSVFSPECKVREGIVIKSAENYNIEGNKQALKWVSEDYLSDNKNTDFH